MMVMNSNCMTHDARIDAAVLVPTTDLLVYLLLMFEGACP
jgi:hypothetical protein